MVEALRSAKPEGFAVWPENMPIVDAWLVVCTQWRAFSMADGRVLWTGLDYAGAQCGLSGAGMVLTPPQWSGLRLMERVASTVLNGR